MMEHDVSLSTLQGLYTLNRFLRENPDVMKQYEAFKMKLKDSDDFL